MKSFSVGPTTNEDRFKAGRMVVGAGHSGSSPNPSAVANWVEVMR